MVYINMDIRFLDIEDDFSTLSDYLEMLSNAMPALVEGEKGRIREHYSSEEDEEMASSVISYLEARLDEGITTRFLGASGAITTWALYEAGVTSMAS